MASAKSHTGLRRFIAWFALVIVVLVVAVSALSLVWATQAQGSGEGDDSTIGIGAVRSTTQEVSAGSRIDSLAESRAEEIASEAVQATDAAQRSITVKDPDPVVVPVAVDYSNANTVAKANEYCTLNPLPTAPRVTPDVNDGTWSSGVASAYWITGAEDGKGENAPAITASGVPLYSTSVTVAVPQHQSYLLGRAVEIVYDGKVVVATVTDTGGFAKYGRVLDLAPGVYKAFGFSTPEAWGTRTVHYRFL